MAAKLSKKMLIVGGTLIEPGQTREVHLPLTERANARQVLLPITVIRGKKEGPRVTLTAAVHGDELNGTAVLRELTTKIKPHQLRGTLIIAPILNIIGFLSRSRYLPDRRDLNRVFPGNPRGNMAQRVAHQIFSQVIEPADFGIDLHTAAYGRENFPHIRGDMSKVKIRKLAKAFRPSIILDHAGGSGQLRRSASKAGIPFVVFEGGTANRFERPIVKVGVEGVEAVLQTYGMLSRKKGKKEKLPFQIIVKKTQWVRSERGGIMELKIRPGSLVYKGDKIATISNPFGKEVHAVHSPLTGLVIGLTTDPVANPGTPIAHVAEIQKTLRTVEKAISSGKFRAPRLL